MRVRRLDKFAEDATLAYAYLAERSPRAADRLLDRIELLIELLSEFPEIGRPRPRFGLAVRSHPVRGFPYLAFYEVEGDEVILLRLWHGAQKLTRKRLRG